MINKITIACAMVAISALGQAQQSEASSAQQSRGILARLHDATTRQQVQAQPLEIAQPANGPQGYTPGVTIPQGRPFQAQPQQAPPQQPSTAPPLGYPPPTQTLPYNRQPTAQQPRGPQQPGAVATPPGSSSSSARSGQASSSTRTNSGSSDESEDKKSSTQSSSSSSKANSSAKKSSTTNSGSSEKKSSSGSSADKDSADSAKKSSDDSSSKKSDSSSASALEKIVKKVESGSKEDSEEAEKPAPVKKTKEEIKAEEDYQASLKEADKATTVVASFLEQANGALYSKATETLAPAIQKYFDSEISVVNGNKKQVLDELTRNGNIIMVTYVNTTVRGEGAVVEAEIGYQDGSTIRRSFELIQLDNKWKIVLPVAGSSSAAEAAPVASSAPQASALPAAPQISTPEQAAASMPPMVMAPPADNTTTTP